MAPGGAIATALLKVAKEQQDFGIRKMPFIDVAREGVTGVQNVWHSLPHAVRT